MKINDIFYGVQRNSSILTPPYVIAEAGVNHEGDMKLAKRLIDEAAEGGAHAIKFQTERNRRARQERKDIKVEMVVI